MAFVRELIPETDKNKIDIEKLSRLSSFIVEPTRWVIDRERDVYLFRLGGGVFEVPDFFGINIHNETVVFEAKRYGVGNNKVGIILSYTISGIRTPSTLKISPDEIKELICEALDAYGVYGDRSHVTSVSVEFPQERERSMGGLDADDPAIF